MNFTGDKIKVIWSSFALPAIEQIKRMDASGNIFWLIGAGGQKYLLRLSPAEEPRYRSPEEISAEVELLDYLVENNFPVEKPIKDKNGQAVITFGKHAGYLRKYTEGVFEENPSLAKIEKFGRLLGRFHLAVENFKTKNNREHIWDLKETKKNFIDDKTLILESNFTDKEKFVKVFEREINALDFPDELPQGTIHEDLGTRHVLWEKEEIVSVIDFDRCYYGKLVLDLGQACRGWCLENDQRWNNGKFKALIGGYREKRELAPLEKTCLADAIKFGILERSLSFCLRSISGQKSLEEYARQSLFNLTQELENNRRLINDILNQN